ncbi:MAG: hypothetical protein R2810_05330 [Flavobacteriales bacterium]
MRTLLPLLFVLGLVMKVLHLPFHTVFLLVVLAVWLVWSVVRMVRRQGKPASWAGLAIWAWCLHLVALLKLFPFRTVTLALALLLTFLALVLRIRRKPFWSPTLQKLAGVFILVMLVMAQPTSERFWTTNLWLSVERGTDARSWDKYSYFLTREGHMDQALEANEHALAAARAAGEDDLLPLLELRREAIASGDWPGYGPLPHP